MDREELNELSHRVIGIAIDVHKQLGPGFVEKIYEKALLHEFEKERVKYERQKIIKVQYRDTELGNQRLDLLVEGEIIVEVKATSKIIPEHKDQIISYLKTANKKLGLILNFGQKRLEVKRVVYNF